MFMFGTFLSEIARKTTASRKIKRNNGNEQGGFAGGKIGGAKSFVAFGKRFRTSGNERGQRFGASPISEIQVPQKIGHTKFGSELLLLLLLLLFVYRR
mgnify:FL=1